MSANGMSPNVATVDLSCKSTSCSEDKREITRVNPWEVQDFVDYNQLVSLSTCNVAKNISGVYLIVNTENNKLYVGQSVNIKRRLKQHLYYAKTGDCHPLPKAIAEYGVQAFKFLVLEQCNRTELHDLEEKWIVKLHANDPNVGYNNLLHQGIGNFDKHGELHPNHHLTDADVKAIRARRTAGEQRHAVYADYADRITEAGFANIWLYETWKQGYVSPQKQTRIPVDEQTKHTVHAIRMARVKGETYTSVRNKWNTLSKRVFDHAWYGTAYKYIPPDVTSLPKPRGRHDMQQYISTFTKLMLTGCTWTNAKHMYVDTGELSTHTFQRYWKTAKQNQPTTKF